MLSRTTERPRIVVTGYVVRGPLGGMAWHFLQYVRGLADLGHDVYYVEDSDDVPFCLHPWMLITDRDPKEGIEFTRKAFDDLALEDRFAYYDAHTGGWLGPCAGRILEVCRTADLLLSVAAWINPLRPWLAEIPARAFLDTDPAFTQIVHLTNAPRKSRASGRQRYRIRLRRTRQPAASCHVLRRRWGLPRRGVDARAPSAKLLMTKYR